MAAWSERAGSRIDKVDPRLRDIMEHAAVTFAQENPGYSVVGISGKKARSSGTKQHPAGWAVDVDIVDPTGKHLGNFRDATSLRTYEKFGQLARTYQKDTYPELTRDFRAGMYFGGGWWGDQMHFDINPEKRGAMSFGSWETGLNQAGVKAYNRHNKTNMNKADLSIGMNDAFPPAPSGPTGWPTPTEKGPGIYGALNPATRAQQYAAAGNRRAYEQGFRPAPTATPQDFSGTTPAAGYGQMAQTLGQAGVPRIGVSPAMQDSIQREQQGPQLARQDALSAIKDVSAPAPIGARVGTPSTSVPSRYGSTVPAGIASVDAQPMRAQPPGSLFAGSGTLTPSLASALAAGPQVAPAPAAVPTAPAPAPAVAAPSAYPDEGRFSMKKGLTPTDMVQMGLTPAQPAPTKVKEAPQAETVTTTPPQVRPAPTIVPAPPAPAKPAGLIGALENLAAPLTSRLTAPFHTLANLAGPVPNPPSRNIGTGSEAISGILGGLGQPGDTAYSRSMPGYSVRDLGNGMVEKTNQYGHKSYERVDKPGGIFTSNPGGLYSAHPSGLFSGGNLGGFAGSLLGGAVAGPFGALAGGWLGNKLGSNFGGTGFGNTANVGPNAFGYAGPWGAGKASVSGGGGLFGGWGGGGGSSSGRSSSSRSSSRSGVSGSGPTSKTSRAEASGYR